MNEIVVEKVSQAVEILKERQIDCWLTFVRETTHGGDPVLPMILDHALTWQSALIVARGGERIAIVGKYDDEAVRSTGAWSEVMPYVEGIGEPLREALGRLDPGRIAVNISKDDVKADGLTCGMRELLLEHLTGTPYGDRLCGARDVIGSLRGRKTPEEQRRIREAVAFTEEIFREIAGRARPGMSEAEIADFARERAAARGLGLAWEADMCPIVTSCSDSMVGHGLPSADLRLAAGTILHLDFGVSAAGYCSDLQRCWYLPRAGEQAPPEAVQKGFDAVRRAVAAAKTALRPGVEGWTVDAAARASLAADGYPEYQHATGHQVGRSAHDGGAVLGPRWERYGDTPSIPIEAGNVFTLELGIDDLDGRGYLGLEEMVLVTDDGSEWLSRPQTELPLLTP